MADTAPALPVETHEATVHDALLETVSVEALQSHDGLASEPSAEAGPEPIEAGTDAETDPDADAPPISAAPDGEPVALDPVAEEPVLEEPVASELVASEPVAHEPVVPEPAPIVTPIQPVPAAHRTPAFDALGELSEANATVAGFLRNEGAAALAHWHSLAGATSPADAVRLQVDEMQRAADASLTCLNTLAQRAGRLAGLLTRG